MTKMYECDIINKKDVQQLLHSRKAADSFPFTSIIVEEDPMKHTSKKAGKTTKGIIMTLVLLAVALAGAFAVYLIDHILVDRYDILVTAIVELIGIGALYLIVDRWVRWVTRNRFDTVKAFPPAEKCDIHVLAYASEGVLLFEYQMEDDAEKEKLLETLSKLEYGGGYYGLHHDRPKETGRCYSVSISCAEEDYHAQLSIGAYPSEVSDRITKVKYSNQEPTLNYLDELLGAA